jgi:hypothetical protein
MEIESPRLDADIHQASNLGRRDSRQSLAQRERRAGGRHTENRKSYQHAAPEPAASPPQPACICCHIRNCRTSHKKSVGSVVS